MQLNQERFDQVVAAALAAVGDNKRWRNAIVRASVEVQVNPFIDFDGQAALILSSTSNEIYRANGQCHTTDGKPCPAFAKGQPCYHRALSRLLAIYHQA